MAVLEQIIKIKNNCFITFYRYYFNPFFVCFKLHIKRNYLIEEREHVVFVISCFSHSLQYTTVSKFGIGKILINLTNPKL